MKAIVVASQPNQGSTFRLIKYAVDMASEGKQVLFVTTELEVALITERMHGYISGTNKGSEDLRIVVRKTKINSMDFIKPYDKFDVIVIDSHYLMFNDTDLTEQYNKLSNIIGDSLLIINMLVTRNPYNNGCVQISRLKHFPKWIDSATYIEKVDGAFVETKIDLHTKTKAEVLSVYKLKMKEIPYLSK